MTVSTSSTKPKKLAIDIETYSSVDLGTAGVYRYCESDDFEILLFGYSIDDGPVTVLDLACGMEIPQTIIALIMDDHVEKWAYNAQFERVCLSRYILSHGYLNPKGWHCSMVLVAYFGLPLSLEKCGEALCLDKQKMTEGKELIRYFCKPCPPTISNGNRTRNYWYHDTAKWELFKSYNQRDVIVETNIRTKLSNLPVYDHLWEEYWMDQRINDRGIRIDMDLVEGALAIDRQTNDMLMSSMKAITDVDNPNSTLQMMDWFHKELPSLQGLTKKSVAAALKEAPNEKVKKVLTLRQQLAKSSVKKYTAMKNVRCKDGRAHGMFQFYGANRSGRFSGRLVQLQNLRQNHLEDLADIRELIKKHDFLALQLLFDSIPDVLSQCIRTAFIPSENNQFYVADYSAIEARVLAWLAGEQWRMDLFKNGGDIYCMSASKMFGVPVVKHGVNGELRQKGKIAELACIAKGQMVLTDHGYKPIETVELKDRVWDGESWVNHEGVVYRNVRKVYVYDGIVATKDHLVYVEDEDEPMELVLAFFLKKRLKKVTKACGKGERRKQFRDLGTRPTYDIKNAGPNHRYTVNGRLVHNCGYGGSVGAMVSMGALEMGLSEDELQPIITSWRNSNPHIVKFWWDVDRAVKKCIKQQCIVELQHCIKMIPYKGIMAIELPSGRRLHYVGAQIDNEGRVTYMNQGVTKKWECTTSYGPKFVENIVQAVSRDLLVYAMMEMEPLGIVAHVHDEMIIDAPKDKSLDEICEQMAKRPSWAEGLITRADGYTCPFYMKD